MVRSIPLPRKRYNEPSHLKALTFIYHMEDESSMWYNIL